MTIDRVIDAWRANCRINTELMSLCSHEDLELKPGKGKTIRSNYVHLIGFRRAWAEPYLAEEAAAIPKLDWKSADRDELLHGLDISSRVMEALFAHIASKPGKWTLPRFFAYAIAHEANHRAQIELALRLNGREPDDAVLYRLWDLWKR